MLRILTTSRQRLASLVVLALVLGVGAGGFAQETINAPDGRRVHRKGGAPQPDLSAYRSPLDSKIVDRRWYTNEGMYLANESNNSGVSFLLEAIKAGFPIAHNEAFAWVTAQEAYWYSRYMLSNVFSQSHLGISMIHGPYWTLKARESYQKNRLQRDRGERMPSNKDVMLGNYLPLFYKRTGFPRVFDDAAPTYLQYASGDPHFTGPIDVTDSFRDPMSGKNGNWGVPRYYIDWRNTRWDRDDMEIEFDLGGIAQTVKKELSWVQYFFHSDHRDASPSDPTREVLLLGNDAEEGFRGVMLTFAAFNSMLEAKTALFYDPTRGKLGGIDPRTYDPAAGVKYLPHRIKPSVLYVGDLPERVWALDSVPDKRSLLWDQASWLWATSDYEWLGVRLEGRVFTDNPPVDAGIIESSTIEVAQGLSNIVVQNLDAMHSRDGVLVSEWSPRQGAGTELRMQDASMALVALQELIDRRFTRSAPRHLGARNVPDLADKLLRSTADFLVRMQGEDGSFRPAYDVTNGVAQGASDLARPNWWAIRALTAAYWITEDDDYLQSARQAWNYLDSNFWDSEHGLFRSRRGDDTVILTPLEVGAATGAMRELMFATPLHEVEPLIERYTRWFVQSRDMSGMQMSEDNRTGELAYGVNGADEDGDGIPFLKQSHGRYGVAPLPASKVAVNLGGSDNQSFAALKGDRHDPDLFSSVSYAYLGAGSQPAELTVAAGAERPATRATVSTVSRPVGAAERAPAKLVKREPMQRFYGTVIPLQPSLPLERGSDHSGREIYDRNCAVCHAADGRGNIGLSLETVASQGRGAVFEVPNKGRFDNAMPPWGVGTDKLAGVLTDEELYRVAEYITTVLFPSPTAAAAVTAGGTNQAPNTKER